MSLSEHDALNDQIEQAILGLHAAAFSAPAVWAGADRARTALIAAREALAARAEGVAALQQAGEPVAWRYRDAWGNWAYCQAIDNSLGPSVNTEKQPLFSSAIRQQVGGGEE